MDVDPAPVELAWVRSHVEQAFGPQAEEKGLELRVELARRTARTMITTDRQRLQQILRNLLANAVKFTDAGHVELRIAPVPAGTVLGRAHAGLGPLGGRVHGARHRHRHPRRTSWR